MTPPGLILKTTDRADGSMALHTLSAVDDPGPVLSNRRRVLEPLGLDPAALVVGEQVHGARAIEVCTDDRGRGALTAGSAVAGVDGLMTSVPGLPLMVLGADCPILVLYDPVRPAVAVVHAGWRGLVAGVMESGLAALGSGCGDGLYAFLGPCAGPCCYEVGEKVAERFPEECVVRTPGRERPTLDLARVIAGKLGRVPERLGPPCTICTTTHYSYRATGTTGRHALIAALRQ
jgi:purine-nucleoside/S-methyl-5'-thioadenosine phosphorylase / adenosine deaminase